jgi:hypothetical protein
MASRTIPILPAGTAAALAAAAPPVRLSGPPERVGRVLGALEAAVGPSARAWLRELRLSEGEAWVAFAPGLGHGGLDSAQRAFDTLRRLLPDTDIYIGADAT